MYTAVMRLPPLSINLNKAVLQEKGECPMNENFMKQSPFNFHHLHAINALCSKNLSY